MTEDRVLSISVRSRPNHPGQFALAAGWVGESNDKVRSWGIGDPEQGDPATMLSEFKRLYDEADVVTGYGIRRFDLPTIHAALLEHGLDGLGPKSTTDTEVDVDWERPELADLKARNERGMGDKPELRAS